MDTGRALVDTGAAAAGTAVLGPVGGIAAGALGDLLYQAFSGGDSTDKASQANQEQLAKASQAYQQYRPMQYGARQQGLQQQLSAYGGAENAMNLMYGSQYDPRNYAPNLGKLPNPQDYAPPPAPAQAAAPYSPPPVQTFQRNGGSTSFAGTDGSHQIGGNPTTNFVGGSHRIGGGKY